VGGLIKIKDVLKQNIKLKKIIIKKFASNKNEWLLWEWKKRFKLDSIIQNFKNFQIITIWKSKNLKKELISRGFGYDL
jgi:hypothetical protein